MTRRSDPWFKMYPRDWLDGTRELSLEQRGAYIDMLCIQYMQNAPIGNPEDNKYKWLAHQLHVSSRKARVIVESLVAAKKFIKTDEGISNNRAAFELVSRANQRRTNDEPTPNQPRAGDENSKNNNENNKPPAKAATKQGATRARSSESDSEKEKKKKERPAHPPSTGGARLPLETPKRATRRATSTEEQFDRFWSVYPIRKGKAAARKLFRALSPADAEHAINAARQYAAECEAKGTEPKYRKYAEGWLNARRFEDYDNTTRCDPIEVVDGKEWGWWRGNEIAMRKLSVERWRAALSTAKPNGTWPWWKLGAPPGHRECLVPQVVREELGLNEIYKGEVRHE
jgi:uncharacterized protein YdaU (DUF1376 family)